MYSENETRYSRDYLGRILNAVSQPPCLMGGWAVYLHVNEEFNNSKGRDYLGSRDIDLGFHLDPNWSYEQYKASDLFRTISAIRELRFEEQSYRFVKRYHSDTQVELSEEQARSLPIHQIFNLYIDLAVDTDDERRNVLVGSSIIDETLLRDVFGGNERKEITLFDTTVILPSIKLLVQMKAKSLPNRTLDDKRTKDLADICALALYKPQSVQAHEGNGAREKNSRFKSAINDLPEAEWDKAAELLDEKKTDLKRVVGELF